MISPNSAVHFYQPQASVTALLLGLAQADGPSGNAAPAGADSDPKEASSPST